MPLEPRIHSTGLQATSGCPWPGSAECLGTRRVVSGPPAHLEVPRERRGGRVDWLGRRSALVHPIGREHGPGCGRIGLAPPLLRALEGHGCSDWVRGKELRVWFSEAVFEERSTPQMF